MSIFSRGSKKRKEFVAQKITKTNSNTGTNYTTTEAQEEYMKKKQEWAETIIEGLKEYCKVLCNPKDLWTNGETSGTGCQMFWNYQNKPNTVINGVMSSAEYKNVKEGGCSSKYLDQVQSELAKLMAKNYNYSTDPENFKSSMQSCGKGLSKLKHPIGSTALVKVGKKGERIVDYVDELARLMLNKCVQENAAKLVKLPKGAEWPANDAKYTYQAMTTKYVKLED